MGQHITDITVINSPLGIPASSDGVCLMVCKAVAISSTFVLDTPYLLTKKANMVTLGITEALDATNKTAIYQHINEFFTQAGDGAKLWVVGIAFGTTFANYVVSDAFKAVVRSTAASDPANKAKFLGFAYDVPTSGQTGLDFPVDVTNTITFLQATREEMFDEGYRWNAVIDGYNMDSTATPTTLDTLANLGAFGVSVLITGTKNNRVSSIGLCLGKIARTSVGKSIGAIADGSLVATSMYLTNQVAITDTSITPADFNTLGGKQFLFARTWLPEKAGYFFNDGATCDLDINPLGRLEFCRLSNKLSDNAYNMFLQDIGSNLPVESNGDLSLGYCSGASGYFYTTYVAPLIISGDLSNAKLTVTGVAFNTTRTVTFKLDILASPALMNISGTIQFVKSL